MTAVKTESEFTPSRRRTLAILYQQLGQLYRETSNYTAAVNTFEEMLRLGAEEDRRARVMIMDTYRDARDMPKALDAARKAVDAYPKDRAILHHAGAAVRRKRAGRSGRFEASRPAGRFCRRFRNSARHRADLRGEQALGGRRTSRSRRGKNPAGLLREGNDRLPAWRDFRAPEKIRPGRSGIPQSAGRKPAQFLGAQLLRLHAGRPRNSPGGSHRPDQARPCR